MRLGAGGGARWDLADLSGTDVRPMAVSDIDALIREATKGVLDEERRAELGQRLTEALRTANRRARPAFPEQWRREPNVMFRHSDPSPEPLDWGPRRWGTDHLYDEELAELLGDLACDRDVAEEQSRGLARRSLNVPDRLYAQRLAARLTGTDCPPAAALPEDVRRRLEELAEAAPATAPGHY